MVYWEIHGLGTEKCISSINRVLDKKAYTNIFYISPGKCGYLLEVPQ